MASTTALVPEPVTRKAHVIEVKTSMLAVNRCDRCGAQAFVEARVKDDGKPALLFCAHHASLHWEVLMATCHGIADHRPALAVLEARK